MPMHRSVVCGDGVLLFVLVTVKQLTHMILFPYPSAKHQFTLQDHVYWASVASLGSVSPAAATNGVTLFFIFYSSPSGK